MVIVCFFKDRTRVLQPSQMVSVFTGYGLWDRKHIWFRIKTIQVNGKSPLWQKNKYVPACALSGQCYDDCLCISHSGSSHYFALIISTGISTYTHTTRLVDLSSPVSHSASRSLLLPRTPCWLFLTTAESNRVIRETEGEREDERRVRK